jgi:hypothetical protein
VKRLGTILYWLTVLVISAALVVLLILFLESRDRGDVGASAPRAPATEAGPRGA